MIWMHWSHRNEEGREHTLLSAPILWSAHPDTPAHISIEVPNVMGGTVKTGLVVMPGQVETLSFTYMPDPPAEDDPAG